MKRKFRLLLIVASALAPAISAHADPTLYKKVQATCGACHNNQHFSTAGDFQMNNGANTKAGGIVAATRGIQTTDMTGGDPLTSLIIQKPLAMSDGSTTLHGGIKLPLSHPTIQALITWVQAGAPTGVAGDDMEPPTQAARSYYNTPGGQHTVVASIRRYRRRSFTSLTGSAGGGNIHRIRFDASNNVTENINLTNLPADEDAANPVVSLDGTKVAFARKQSGQPWQIWEVGIDGTGLRQITNGAGDKVQPFYLPYQNDGTPARSGEGGVGFVSNRSGFLDEYDQDQTLSLFIADANGNNLRQIDFNPSHDLSPWLHSSGVTIFTRWEHNEHQGHNFMPLFGICVPNVAQGGVNLFGAYGEHGTSPAGNSLHEASEVYYSGTTPGFMMARGSNRDDAGGSVVGFFRPKLEGDAGSAPTTNILIQGDNERRRMGGAAPLGYTFRYPRSLLNDKFIVSRATQTGVVVTSNTFNGTVSTTVVYGHFELYTFDVSGNTGVNLQPLLAVPGFTVDEAVPVIVQPTPPFIGKPIDLTQNTGFFTSGDVRERQNDGQPQITSVEGLTVRFVRALQFSQGRVNTGRRRGIATQIVGEAPIHEDGSFFAEVPADTPIQFQLIRNNTAIVKHKPWVQVARGETMRCVGCHANHSQPAKIQTLAARQAPAQQVDTKKVKQFYFKTDIQPYFNAKCVVCHDSAKAGGAAGRNRQLSLTGRETPADVSEAYQSLAGMDMDSMSGTYVQTQNSLQSPLLHWLTGKDANGNDFPTPADSVNHPAMSTADEIIMLRKWIDTGATYRQTDTHDRTHLRSLDVSRFTTNVWPMVEASCYACHSTGGAGVNAMNLDMPDAESQAELDEHRANQFAWRSNYINPEASLAVRKPLPLSMGGLTHVGGAIFTGRDDPQYVALIEWIKSSNVRLAAGVGPTDLVRVTNYPNPFRDKTYIVYGLTGSVATKIELSIYSIDGQEIRELSGPADSGITIGWNKVEWDGKDRHGREMGVGTYLYKLTVNFGDGTKKVFKGKCVKVP